MARPVNVQIRQERMAEIMHVARQQLAEQSAEGLSLRAIARRLELAPNSLYNYFPSLDDLITALLVDAFKRLAEAVEAAAAGAGSYSQRFIAVCHSYRHWAVSNRGDYDLIFGRPLPGYHAPGELTNPLSMRALRSGLNLLIGAWRAGELGTGGLGRPIPPSVAGNLTRLAQPNEGDVPPVVYALMLLAWSRMHGLVMLENHGHYDESVGDTAAFYGYAIAALLEDLGLPAI